MKRPEWSWLVFGWIVLEIYITEITDAATVCLRGTYFDGSRCLRCPGGTYGDRPGFVTAKCSGTCEPGHFCPPGSTSATQNVCGSSRFYCPQGSAMRLDVGVGYYTISAPFPTDDIDRRLKNTAVNTAYKQLQCEPGYYCMSGVRRPCPAGTFGDQRGLTTPACVSLCPKGYYCPEGTAVPLPCPPGRFGSDLGLATKACSGMCPIGHYCESATIFPRSCPAGSFGGQLGLTTKDCSAMCSTQRCVPSPCPAGYYCPLATVNPFPCGSPSVYCPRGSISPITALVGYYTTWKTARGLQADGSRLEDGYVEDSTFARLNLTTRTDQQPCEPGTYCVSGVKRWCPAGTYGASSGLATPQCTGSCPPGYYCPLGTADYAHFPCNARDAYCRVGSSAPTPVSTGYFTVTASTGETRIDQTICPTGSYCTGGVSYLCPAGTFGATTGLSTALCSGRCQDGYVCPRGSTSATQSPCPAGLYSRNGITCAPCAPGYWCSAGSPDPKQNACGSENVYCPLGSSGPANVANGYYASGQMVTTHTTQVQCRVQTVYHLPQCPTRTVGANSGL